MQENEFDMIADDEKISLMQKEYEALGVGKKISKSKAFSYPLPIYMTGACEDFCKCSNAMAGIISGLDKMFVSRNKKTMDFILGAIVKNRILISMKSNLNGEIFVPVDRMPLKQSMYRLLELHNSMSIILSELTVYDNSAQHQEIVLRHILLGSVLHGLCI